LTLIVPRAGGVSKAVAFYGEVPLFGLSDVADGPSKALEEDMGGRVVHAAGDTHSGMGLGIEELVKMMVFSAGVPGARLMSNALVSLCLPCGAAGVCQCNPAGGSLAAGAACGQVIVAPLWDACDFDVYVTQLPAGIVPPALYALDAVKAGATIIRDPRRGALADEPQQSPDGTPRPQFYSVRATEPSRSPRVFLGECCARTYVQEHTRRMLRSPDSLPHPSILDPVYGKPTEIVSIPVHRTPPQGSSMTSLASTFTTFLPCNTPRIVAVDRRVPSLMSSRVSQAEWSNVYGGCNYILLLTKSVAGHAEMRRDVLPARCGIQLAPVPLSSSSTRVAGAGAALATHRGSKRSRADAGAGGGAGDDVYEGK
jgi:hypothetical protein